MWRAYLAYRTALSGNPCYGLQNPKMKLVEQLRRLDARVRVVISGTPIQNNLMEMHALFDFTTEGLLGDARTFKMWVGQP